MTALFVQLGAASFLVPPRSWPLGAYRTPETLTRLQHFASVRYASMGYSRRHASAGNRSAQASGTPVTSRTIFNGLTIRLHSLHVNRQIGVLTVARSRLGARAGRAVQHSFFVQSTALKSRMIRLLQLRNRLPRAPSAVGHVAHELASANSRQRVVEGRFACSSGAPPRSRKGSRLRILCPRLWCSSFRGPDLRCGPRGFLGICFVVDPQPGWGHRTPHASGRSPLLPARRTIKRQRIGFRVS